MNTLIPLLRQSIDYAGLFPPASLSLSETVENYRLHRNSTASLMLSRLVIPVSKLAELGQTVESQSRKESQSPVPQPTQAGSVWPIAALLNPILQPTDRLLLKQALETIRAFNQQFDRHPQQPLKVDSLEFRFNFSAIPLPELYGLVQAFRCYLEIDCLSDPEPAIAAISRLNSEIAGGFSDGSSFPLSAKIRTGSTQADQIPSSAAVARFIDGCRRHQVSFKATAGLHHPLRGEYPLTYEADAPMGMMHGYLNVFVGTMLSLRHGIDQNQLVQVLEEREGQQFLFDQRGLHWRGLIVESEIIEQLRGQGIHSFGSCSFEEPAAELAAGFTNIFR
jgi:hypothetical protein